MKWSTASESCVSVANAGYAFEQTSVVRAAYAAMLSTPDCACAKLRAERTFELESAEQRFDTALELRVVCDGICEVRAPNFFSFLCAERSHEKVLLVVHRARAHAQIKLEVGNKSSDLVAGQLAEPRSTRKLEQRVGVFVIPVGVKRSRLRPG